MHESIAAAYYKGHKRKLNDRVFDLSKSPAMPKTRKAWLEAIIKQHQANPYAVLMQKPLRIGKGKNVQAYLIGVYYTGDQQDIRSDWVGYVVHAKAKTFDIIDFDLPVLIVGHLVERTMQRLNVQKPSLALHSLERAFDTALHLGAPTRGSVYLPSAGGVVVAKQDEDEPSRWVFVTFIDEAKLKPEQIREAEFWGNLAIKKSEAAHTASSI